MREVVIDEMKRLISPRSRLPIRVPPSLYGELRAVLNRYIQTLVGSVPRLQVHLPSAVASSPMQSAGNPRGDTTDSHSTQDPNQELDLP